MMNAISSSGKKVPCPDYWWNGEKKKNVTECKEPKYLCCDGNDPKDYSCDP